MIKMNLSFSKEITVGNITYKISDQTFWHVVVSVKDERFAGGFIYLTLSNIFNNKGLFDLQNILQETKNIQASKQNNYHRHEEIFENIRKEKFFNLPSRYKSAYLFKTKKIAEEMICKWNLWDEKEPRPIILKCHIVNAGSPVIFEGDFSHIDKMCENSREEEIKNNAINYWGTTTIGSDYTEILADALLYFPEWETLKEYHLVEQTEKILFNTSNSNRKTKLEIYTNDNQWVRV